MGKELSISKNDETFEYYIGIPTYKRARKQCTLDYLEQIGVPKEKIIMSVQTDEDYTEYKAAGYENRVRALIKRDKKNLSGNRNTILDYLEPGKRIVIFDDDIHYIGKLDGKELNRVDSYQEFEKLIKAGYSLASKYHTALWGVYPAYNAYFMRNKIAPKNIIVGNLMGLIITDLRYNEDFNTKEDYEFSCQAIRKYGAAVRLDNYACNAPHRNSGGCAEFWEKTDEVQKTAKRLVGMYPDILRMNPRRSGEVLMKRGK